MCVCVRVMYASAANLGLLLCKQRRSHGLSVRDDDWLIYIFSAVCFPRPLEPRQQWEGWNFWHQTMCLLQWAAINLSSQTFSLCPHCPFLEILNEVIIVNQENWYFYHVNTHFIPLFNNNYVNNMEAYLRRLNNFTDHFSPHMIQSPALTFPAIFVL